MLEDVLETELAFAKAEVLRLKAGLATKSAERGANAVVGNLGRVPAGVRLHWAVEEAIAWTAEPPGGDEDRSDSYVERCVALLKDAPPNARPASPKWNRLHASKVGPLFMALRYAFLQDDEELPLALRRVLDENTGTITRIKSNDRASLKSGSAYIFAEKWAGLQDLLAERERRLPPEASHDLEKQTGEQIARARRQKAQARQLQSDIKREAHKRRKDSIAKGDGSFEETLAPIRLSIMTGLMGT